MVLNTYTDGDILSGAMLTDSFQQSYGWIHTANSTNVGSTNSSGFVTIGSAWLNNYDTDSVAITRAIGSAQIKPNVGGEIATARFLFTGSTTGSTADISASTASGPFLWVEMGLEKAPPTGTSTGSRLQTIIHDKSFSVEFQMKESASAYATASLYYLEVYLQPMKTGSAVTFSNIQP